MKLRKQNRKEKKKVIDTIRINLDPNDSVWNYFNQVSPLTL